MSVQQAGRIVNYAMTLDNGETCEAFYTARLRNPFIGKKGDGIELDGRSPRTAATDQFVLVVDKYGDAIVIYDEDEEKLVLTELAVGKALGEYGLGEFNVEYSFKEGDPQGSPSFFCFIRPGDVCAEVLKTYLARKDRDIAVLTSYAKKMKIATTLTLINAAKAAYLSKLKI